MSIRHLPLVKGHPLPCPCHSKANKISGTLGLKAQIKQPPQNLSAPFIVLMKFYHISIDHSIVIVQQFFKVSHVKDFPGGSDGKESTCNTSLCCPTCSSLIQSISSSYQHSSFRTGTKVIHFCTILSPPP